MFSTLMFERHNTPIAIFGGKPGEQVQYKGMAGNQVLEWADLDTEIKTAGVKNVSDMSLSCPYPGAHNVAGPPCTPRPVSLQHLVLCVRVLMCLKRKAR